MFGLDLESRTLCSTADEDNLSFLIGTHNIKMDNQICRLSVDTDCSRLSSTSFPHPKGEVRSLAPSPHQPDTVAAAVADFRSSSPSFSLNIYRMDDAKRVLESSASLDLENCPKSFSWEPQTDRGCSLHGDSFRLFDMRQGIEPLIEQSLSGEVHSQSWSPHNGGSCLGVAVDRDLLFFDTREQGASLRVPAAHAHRALHLDFNPNLQHVIASSGDDGAVRLWDWRQAKNPLLTLHPHAHWAWQVRFHPVHDQLLLSTGSDACVVLSCARSMSSERDGGDSAEADDGAEKLDDGQLERIEEHEESVYACAWSAADAWTFASISFDGRVVVSRVKRKHKYALMQL